MDVVVMMLAQVAPTPYTMVRSRSSFLLSSKNTQRWHNCEYSSKGRATAAGNRKTCCCSLGPKAVVTEAVSTRRGSLQHLAGSYRFPK